MKKQILILLLPDFADWEVAFVSATLNDQIQNIESPYFVKTVGITKEPIKSIGGLTIVPDYDIEDAPTDYSALLLIGGMSWCTKERKESEIAKKAVPFVQKAVDNNLVIGAICDATTFLGANGWLNKCQHTSNTLEDLQQVAGSNYTNSPAYLPQQSVWDKTIITANGTAYLEFTRDVLSALQAYQPDEISTHYQFYKDGYYEAMKIHGIAKGI